MKHYHNRLLLIPWFLMALTSCASTDSAKSEPAPQVRQITQSAHCGLTGPGVAYIRSPETLESLLGVVGQNMATGVIREVDLAREQLIIVTLGQKPTAGYSLGLDSVSRENSTLKLDVQLTRPAPGTMVAQVITSPCVVLAVAGGDWRRIEVAGVTERPIVKLTGQ
ncbi:protease complex subunit PrcB family protein [Marinobacter sp.]|uniref:protease complex subunit PrcB family protein n=1 Tax=Marinobacter sp. TaxID=50741 RepID=UPI0035683850